MYNAWIMDYFKIINVSRVWVLRLIIFFFYYYLLLGSVEPLFLIDNLFKYRTLQSPILLQYNNCILYRLKVCIIIIYYLSHLNFITALGYVFAEFIDVDYRIRIVRNGGGHNISVHRQ